MQKTLTHVREAALQCSLAELSENHRWWHNYAREVFHQAKNQGSIDLYLSSRRYQTIAGVLWRVIEQRCGCPDPFGNIWHGKPALASSSQIG